jgi:hypothetical protein
MKAIACHIVLSVLCLVPVLTPPAVATSSTVSGYISDAICGTKGATVGYADCTNKCLTKGAQLVVVVDGTQQMLVIDNPDVVKGHECHHVLLTGDINKQTSTIHVFSLRLI